MHQRLQWFGFQKYRIMLPEINNIHYCGSNLSNKVPRGTKQEKNTVDVQQLSLSNSMRLTFYFQSKSSIVHIHMYIILCVRACVRSTKMVLLQLTPPPSITKCAGKSNLIYPQTSPHQSFDTPTTYSDSKTCTVINTEKILQMWLLHCSTWRARSPGKPTKARR